jgi:hypothetical protein
MRPLFIICSDSGTEDKQTGLVSLFNISEKLTLEAHAPPDGDDSKKMQITALLRFQVLAVWMKEADDEGKYFESRFWIEAPGREAYIAPVTDSFIIPHGKHLQRFRLNYEGPPFFKQSGVLRFASELREVGTEKWLSQDYVVIVETVGDLAGAQDVNLGPPEKLTNAKEPEANRA